ncbi:peptide chain release factor N(5)-glutamine methyltransferase [Vibrio sp. WJH972]
MTDSIESLISQAEERFTKSGSNSPQLDAEVLLCHVIDKPRSYLFTWPERCIEDGQLESYQALVHRREQGEPIAYIVGSREFWSLPLQVSPSTLIPRPDTERLVELALEKATQTEGSLLDLGTGTGAIALALASELPFRQVVGVDYQPEAVALAKANGEQLNIKNCEFVQGDWFGGIESGMKFAVIVSNPPYIDAGDPHLSQGDVRFEPASALVAEQNGLADIVFIAKQSSQFLLEGGWLLFEHGFEQGCAVRDILLELNFDNVTTETDYSGLDRVTLGQYKVN